MNTDRNLTDANRLYAYRKKYNLRQLDVATILGFEVTERISHWEHGSSLPGLVNLLKLCALYKVPPQELYPDLYIHVEQELQARLSKMNVSKNFTT
jgi:transcriptional regulator with XRE-family HTH domain